MNTKLTLRIDDELIKSAKEYSARTGRSISRIVADLFELIRNESKGNDTANDTALPPAVRSLKGALKGSKSDESDYKKYLEEKFYSTPM